MSQNAWVDFKNEEYTASAGLWEFARDHYTGDVVLANQVKKYIVKRATGEDVAAFEERCSLADYSNHFGALVDTLAGMLFAVEADATRTFNPDAEGEERDRTTLGDPADPATHAGRLWADADGRGNGWLTVFKLLATDLIHQQTAWVFVDPANGFPRVRILPNESVTNWMEDGDGNLVEAVIQEKTDARESIMDKPASETQWLVLNRSGWKRYRKDKDGNVVPIPGEDGRWNYQDREGNPTVPMFRVRLPLKRYVGYSLARKANVIFNKESERDHLLRTANFPKLVLFANDELFKVTTDNMRKGWNVLQAEKDGAAHQYITPPSEAAAIASEVLKEKVEAFWRTGFREYGDSAAERTATEVRQDVAAGVGAFLQLLKAALDDAENRAWYLVEQSLWEGKSQNWGHGSVERSEDFAPVDVNSVVDRMRDRYFGKDSFVPVGRRAKKEAAKQIAQWDGLPITDAEADAAVDIHTILQTIQVMDALCIPEDALVQMSLKYLVGTGLVDPEAQMEDGDGNLVKMSALLERQIRDMAAAKVTAARREAEFWEDGGTPVPGNKGTPDA